MKLNGSRTYLIIAALFALIALTLTLKWKHDPATPPEIPASITQETITNVPTQYSVKEFDIAGKIDGLSASQLKQHMTLYAGYVKSRNEIAKALETADRINAKSRTYSHFRSLKIAETYAVNGSILHELYFENLSPKPTKMGPLTEKLIIDSFGSLEAFKQDFMASGNSARGWVLTCYSLDDKLVHNYVLEEHNQHVPVLAMPLLVLDVYEHAYMIDFGIQRSPYLQVFWDAINWDIVEERVQKWVRSFTAQ
ncbi:MAG: superoxide dismutase [Candidatus Babeliales bacterium]